MTRIRLVLSTVVIIAAACSPVDRDNDATPAAGASSTTMQQGPSFQVPLPAEDLYDPVRAGEETPVGYRPSLPRDAIFPVYDPSFVAASQVDWADDILVIGVDLEGEARAYPVGFLNRREIVIDRHRGIPTLVTW